MVSSDLRSIRAIPSQLGAAGLLALVTNDGHETLTRFPLTLSSLVVGGWKPLTRIKGKLVQRRLGISAMSTTSSVTNRKVL